MQSPTDENLCDISGICCAPYGARGVTLCIHCGKELVEIDGQWFTWDYEFKKNPQPQAQEGAPWKT